MSMVSCIFYLYLYLLSIVFFNSRSTAPPPATSGPGPMSFIGASIHTLNVFCPYPWGTFIPEPHNQPLSLFVFEMSITSCIREFPGGLPCPTPASPPTSISWPRAPASPQPDSWHRFPDLLIHKNVRPPANMLSFCVWIFAFQRRSRRGLPTSERGLAIQGTSSSLFYLKLLAFFHLFLFFAKFHCGSVFANFQVLHSEVRPEFCFGRNCNFKRICNVTCSLFYLNWQSCSSNMILTNKTNRLHLSLMPIL